MKRSKIKALPEATRGELDRELIKHGFADYDVLVAWCQAHGIDISRSSLHRYGSKLERRIAALKNSTEAARLIAESAPDDADLQSSAVMRMVQGEMFDVMIALQALEEDADPMTRAKLLAQMAKAIAPMTRASVYQKKHELEIRDKVAAVAERASKIARKAGLTAEGVDSIRREILGIAA